MKFFKKILGFITIIILIGLIVNIVCLSNIGIPVANNNDWIGFWGSIIGSLLGAFVTVEVLKKTIAYEADKQKKEIVPFLRYKLVEPNNKVDNRVDGSIVVFYKEIFNGINWNTEKIDESLVDKSNKKSGDSKINPDIKLNLNVENIGLGAAVDIKVINISGNLDWKTSNKPNVINFTGYNELQIRSIKIDENINIDFNAYLNLNGYYNSDTNEATWFNRIKDEYRDDYIKKYIHSDKNNHLIGKEIITITLEYKTLRSETYIQNIEVECEWTLTMDKNDDKLKLRYYTDVTNIGDAYVKTRKLNKLYV